MAPTPRPRLKTNAAVVDARANKASAEEPRQVPVRVRSKAGVPREPTFGPVHGGRIAIEGDGPRGWRPVTEIPGGLKCYIDFASAPNVRVVLPSSSFWSSS